MERRGADATPPVKRILKNSQESKVLEHLKKYKSITSMDAFRLYEITRLSAVVFDLRKHGHKIITIPEKSKSGSNYARYYLRKD